MTNTNPVTVLADFDGRSIGLYTWDSSILRCQLNEEPLVMADFEKHNYNLHFNIGLNNSTTQDRVIKIQITPPTEHKNIVPTRIYSSDSEKKVYSNHNTIVTKIPDGYEFEIVISAKTSMFLSNTKWIPLHAIQSNCKTLTRDSKFNEIIYGTSVQNNELIAYKSFNQRDPSKPIILITSGFHPAEGDSIASESILTWLLSNQNDHLNKFDFLIIPTVNPDGFNNGFNGCNSRGINFYWDFQNTNKTNCPEAYYLWQLIRKYPPNLYVDFHSYTAQGGNKVFGPYFKPNVFYFGNAIKEAAHQLLEDLQTLEGSKSQMLFAPSSLAYKITKEFNTITFAKYHLHQDLGSNGMEELAISVIEKLLTNIPKYSLSEQLLFPYGDNKKTFHEIMYQNMFISRYMLPKIIRKILKSN